MRYEVRVGVEDISAAHFLPGYPGPCANLHGHNWSVEVRVGAERLDQGDMVVDFALLKAVVKKVDHTCLNDDPEIVDGGHRATAERLAEVLATRLQRVLDPLPNRPRVLSLAVRETGRNEVVFNP